MPRLDPEKLAALLDAADDGIYVAEAESGALIDVNDAACAMLGYTREEILELGLTGIKAPALVGPETQLDRQVQSLETRSSFTKTTRHRRKDGTTFPVEIRIYLREIDGRRLLLGIVRNLGADDVAQSELRAEEGLTTMSKVAGRLGHELNNPLTFVIGGLEVARRRVDAERTPELDAALADVAQGVERIASVLRDLDVLSRGRTDELETLDPEPILRAALRYVEPRFPVGTEVAVEIESGLRVFMRAADLREVMIHLLTNAAAALAHAPLVQRVHLHAKQTAKDTVSITVRDTGEGFGEATAAKIFDPFFTTRSAAVASGLGLTVCKRLVSAAGGRIEARSKPGAGAKLRIELPLVAEPSDAPSPFPEQSDETRVLIVDDEPLIGMVLSKMLEPWGARSVHSPAVALQLLDDMPPDVVICDLMMPGLDGRALYEKATANRPELADRFIFITAGALTGPLREFADGLGERCLRKPIDRETLTRRVEAILNRLDR